MPVKFNAAIQYVHHRLTTELSPLLTYHSLWHTERDVVVAARRIAKLEGLVGEERMLLLTAAWYHDVGFTIQRIDHEDVGMVIAGEVLPDFGYSQGQVAAIQGMIRATKLPQSPRTPLEEMTADADLDSISREDFLKTSFMLKAELDAYGVKRTYPEWYVGQKTFLSGHRYFRQTQRDARDAVKQANIQFLDILLAEVERVVNS